MMALPRLVSLIVVLLASLRAVSAQYPGAPVFAGCTDATNVPAPPGVQQIFSATDPTSCASNCFANDYSFIFSYFRQLDNACYCSTKGIPGDDYSVGTSSTGGCLQTSYSVMVTRSTLTFGGCYSDWTTGGGTVSGYYVDNLEDCFQSCGSSVGSLAYDVGDPGLGTICLCPASGVAITGQTPIPCSATAVYIYNHNPYDEVGGPSNWIKRKKREFLDLTSKSVHAVCPEPLTACTIPGTALAFECLDAKTELESCGGCMHGTFGVPGSIKGVDCTSLPGVARGAVTCDAGQCIVTQCRIGFTLQENECVPLTRSEKKR